MSISQITRTQITPSSQPQISTRSSDQISKLIDNALEKANTLNPNANVSITINAEDERNEEVVLAHEESHERAISSHSSTTEVSHTEKTEKKISHIATSSSEEDAFCRFVTGVIGCALGTIFGKKC